MNYYRTLTLAIVLSTALASGLTACSSRKIRSEMTRNEMLFPLGTYQHQVRITTAAGPNRASKEFSFSGVVRTSKEEIKIAALSPFGTTLLKIQEDRTTGKVTYESYLESFKKYESKFQDYYSILRLMLISPESPASEDHLRILKRNPLHLPDEAETTDLNPNAIFSFRKYDENKIPEEVVIQHPKFSVTVRVTGYEI